MKKLITLFALLFLYRPIMQAQVITTVPPTTGNDRFLGEIYSNIKRPGLSIIGFDNGGNHSKGYGLKHVIENIYNGIESSLFKSILLGNNFLTKKFVRNAGLTGLTTQTWNVTENLEG